MSEMTNNKPSIDQLIEQLPDNFPGAIDMIKQDIVPQLIACDQALQDHYIKTIKKKTKAASIKAITILIDEALAKISESSSEKSGNPAKTAQDDPEIIQMAEQIALDPQLFKKKIDLANQLGVVGERRNLGVYFLVIDSRLLPMGAIGSNALSAKNSGHQGGGKSYPMFITLKFYPKSAYMLITSGSEKFIYSLDTQELRHKTLVLAEALSLESHGRDSEIAYGVRSLLSEGHLIYQYTKMEGSNRLTVTKRIEGPTSLLTTTVQGKLEDQLDDRMITIHPNTTDQQTRCIIERTASVVSGSNGTIDQKTIKAWQRFHNSLVPVEVVIPFADGIAQFVSRWKSLPTSARRAFKRFLSAIMTIALVYQQQRSKDDQGRVIAEFPDYFIAHQLLEKSFAESLGNIERHTDDRIRMIGAARRMTPKALSEKTGVSTSAISQWSTPLIERGVLGWCDENGAEFKVPSALEKAKRSGKAHLYVAGGKSLPTVFQLKGDPRWDKGGELYAAYDLELDGPEIAGSVELNDAKDDGLMRFDESASIYAQEPKKTPVKLLSVKSHSDVLKMVSDHKAQKSMTDHGDGIIKSLEDQFGEILLNDSYKVANS